jgi:hypothetical protein
MQAYESQMSRMKRIYQTLHLRMPLGRLEQAATLVGGLLSDCN